MAQPETEPTFRGTDSAEWQRLVELGLNGRDIAELRSSTRDGIAIEPLYQGTRDAPRLRGRGAYPWLIVQIVDDPDPDRANKHAREAIKGGATGLALRFAADGKPTAALPPTQEALHVALEAVDLAAVHLRLEPCAASPNLARWARDLVAQRGIAAERAKIAYGLDLLRGGESPQDLERRLTCFAELRDAGYAGPLADLDGRPVHEAGGSEAQELAAVLAAAVCWLRALDANGATATALPCFGASVSVDRDQWLSVAKLRALRLLWGRLLEVLGAPPVRLPIHAETSRRMMTRADPHANIVRATIAALAAGIGGADSLAVLPFTAALGSADANANALARNTQHLLLEESQLHRVADPAAGSGAVEALTAALAEAAWHEFTALEREGGLMASLAAGAFQARIAGAREALRAELAGGKTPLVGSTLYREAGVEPMPVDDQPIEPLSEKLAPVRLEQLAREPS